MHHFVVVVIAVCVSCLGVTNVYATTTNGEKYVPPISFPIQTPRERFCWYLGEVAAVIVVGRDKPVSLETTVSHLRSTVARDLQPALDATKVIQELVDLARKLYEERMVTPTMAQRAFITRCLNPLLTTTPAPAASP